jgi:hypothetical protein
MWLRIYQISGILAIVWFSKMQFYGESFFSENNTQAKSSLHSGNYGRNHTIFHK